MINPPVIGINTKTITCGDKAIILINIPFSISKPHFVRNTKGGPFPVRVGRTTNYWSMGEVSNYIISRHYSSIDLDKKVDRIMLRNENEKIPQPFLLVIGLPAYSSIESVNFREEKLLDLIRNNPFNIHSNTQLGFQFCYEGIQIVTQCSRITTMFDVLRVHRSGIVESTFTNLLGYTPEGPLLNQNLIKANINTFLEFYKSFLSIINFYDPVVLCVYFKNITNKCLFTEVNRNMDVWNYSSIWPESVLRFQISFSSGFEVSINDLLIERINNAFNWEHIY